MSIFTARENFTEELVTGDRHCQSCMKSVCDKIALVNRWTTRKGKQGMLVVCNEECWSDYDHNYWLERAAKKADARGDRRTSDQMLHSRLPVWGNKSCL